MGLFVRPRGGQSARNRPERGLVTKVDRRADTLRRALEASVRGDVGDSRDFYTEGVRAWSPGHDVSSREDLLAEQFTRFDAFSDVDLDAVIDVVGNRGYAEWKVTAVHSGSFMFDDVVVAPTGNRLELHGMTVAEFEGDRIAQLRQYWDEDELFEGLGLAPPA
jgi:ketosteroid isomerase-like protein